MRAIVLTLMVAGVLATASSDALAANAVAPEAVAPEAVAPEAVAQDVVTQNQATVVRFHFSSMKPVRTGVVTLLNVRAFVDSAQIEADEAELSMADGRLRLVLKGGGTVTLQQRAQVEVVTGPYDRLQRDEGLTTMLHRILFPLPQTRVKIIEPG